MAKRAVDLLVASVLLLLGAVPMLCIALVVRLTSKGSVIYWSDRLTRHHRPFKMPKFRTMRPETPELPADRLVEPERWLTPPGRWLRKTSLDELPQLWSVLTGEMSLVGPRPALYNQAELIALRAELGIDQLTPGVTGWPQVNGRDAISLTERVALDVYYLEHRSMWFDLKILLITVWKVLRGDGTEVPPHLRFGGPKSKGPIRKAWRSDDTPAGRTTTKTARYEAFYSKASERTLP